MSRARRRPSSLVTLANDKFPIITACNLAGLDIPEGVYFGRSLKVHCPFEEIYHSDGGTEPALRIYPDSNSAFCFAGCGYFTPVWLLSQAWGVAPRLVAAELLDRIGHKPLSLAERWEHLKRPGAAPDTDMLAEALKIFCARIRSDWATAQFAPDVAAKLGGCLELLNRVRTDEDARQWLDGCKRVMTAALDNDRCKPGRPAPYQYLEGQLGKTKGHQGG